MNFCFISREYGNGFRSGGIRTYLNTVVEELIKQGHEVTVITGADNNSIEYCPNLKIYKIPFYDFFKTNTIFDKLISKIRSVLFFDIYRLLIYTLFKKLCQSKTFDYVEVPDYGAESLYILKLHKAYFPKITCRLHGPSFIKNPIRDESKYTLFNRLNNLEKFCINKSDHVSSPSKFMSQVVETECRLCTEIKVIPNPISDYFISQTAIKKASCNNFFNVGYVGTLSEIKGVKLLISAINNLNLEKEIKFTLNLAGKITAEMEEYLKSNRTDAVSYFGLLSKQEVNNLYQNSDLVVIPSYREAFGLVAVEAMSASAVVLASNAGALPEIIQDGHNGFLFNCGDEKDLIKKIKCIAKFEYLNEIKESAIFSVEKYSSTVYVNRLKELI